MPWTVSSSESTSGDEARKKTALTYTETELRAHKRNRIAAWTAKHAVCYGTMRGDVASRDKQRDILEKTNH